MSYNSNHVPSIDYVNEAIINAYEKMKVWLTTNVDQLDYVQRILSKEIEALRESSGSYTSAYEAAEALNTSVANIVSTLENEGYDLTGVTTQDLHTFISSAINAQGIFILDVNEDEWTAEEWNTYIAEHGEAPAIPAAIGVRTSDGIVYFALTFANATAWGTYGATVGNIDAYSGGFVGTPKNGLNNTLMLIAQFNPAVLLGSQYAIADGASATKVEAESVKALFFETLESLESWGTQIGAVGLAELGTAKMYTVILDATAGTYTNYYYSGAGSSVTFAAARTVPYVDTKNITGVPAAEVAWGKISEVPFTTGNNWVSYLPSIFELGVLFLNKVAIQEALEACGGAFSTAQHWSCLQNNANNAYYVELGAGTVITNTKNNAYVPRACYMKL